MYILFVYCFCAVHQVLNRGEVELDAQAQVWWTCHHWCRGHVPCRKLSHERLTNMNAYGVSDVSKSQKKGEGSPKAHHLKMPF